MVCNNFLVESGLLKVIGLTICFLMFFSHSIDSRANCSSQNMLSNAGFELYGWKRSALHWQDNSSWADVDISYTSTIDKDRQGKVQRIDIDAVRQGAVQFVQPRLSLRAQHTYKVSIWMRGEVSAPLQIMLRRQGKPYTIHMSSGFRINNEWTEYGFQAVAPSDDGRVYFMLRTKGKGWIELDDALVSDVTECSGESPKQTDNRIYNGSFEVGLERWAVQQRETEYEHMAQVRWETKPAVITSKTAAHGQSALEIVTPENGKTRVSSPYVKVEPGGKVSLSFYAKSSFPRKLKFGVVAGDYGKQYGLKKIIQINEKWQRFILIGELPISRDNAYVVFIESLGEGRFWLDGIQLEKADMPTLYKSANGVEIGFDQDRGNLLFTPMESVNLPIRVYAPGQDEVEINIWQSGMNHTKEKMKSINLQLDSDGYGLLFQTIDTMVIGYKKFVASVSAEDGGSALAEIALGVVPAVKDILLESPFGNHAWFSPSGLEQARKIGVRWLRLHPPYVTKWAIVETKQGQFDFYDDSLKTARQQGFSILGSLDATPRWAGMSGDVKFRHYRASPPKKISDWENYVKKTVAHYRGIIDYWEVWNEPDGDSFLNLPRSATLQGKAKAYTRLLQVAYTTAKEVNSDAVIVGGSSSGRDPLAWLEAIATEGALEYMDVFSFHRYTGGMPGDVLDVSTGELVESLRRIMRKYSDGDTKPIWESESGAQYIESQYDYFMDITGGYAVPAIEAAAYVVRNQIHLIEQGVEKWFYYGATSNKRADRVDYTGMFEWDGSPRPVAVAYAVMSHLLEELRYDSSRDIDDVHVVRFSNLKKNEIVDIVWMSKWQEGHSRSIKVSSSSECARAEVTSMMGELDASYSNVGAVAVSLGMEPVYVHWSQCETW